MEEGGGNAVRRDKASKFLSTLPLCIISDTVTSLILDGKHGCSEVVLVGISLLVTVIRSQL